MPELKRNFLKGKMNKDLDERLVPNGEYRDALNIEVSTSQGSDVGSVQSVSANKAIESSNVVQNIYASACTVGSYEDPENGSAYNFVKNASGFTATAVGTKTKYTGVLSDAIIEIKPSGTSSNDELIFCDVYEVRLDSATLSGSTISNLSVENLNYSSSLTNIINPAPSMLVRPGMRVQLIDIDGNDQWGANNYVVVKSVNTFTQTATISKVEGLPSQVYDSATVATGAVLRFTAPRILNFRSGNLEQETNNVYLESSFTPEGTIISSISKVDDFLFWTDNINEPKKINVKRSRLGCAIGSASALKYHTKLVIEVEKKYTIKGFVKESHITVAKPNPTLPPRIKLGIESVNNVTVPVLGKELNSSSPFAQFSLSNINNEAYEAGTEFLIAAQGNTVWQVNDILRAVGISSSTLALFRVLEYIEAVDSTPPHYRVSLNFIPESYAGTEQAETWLITLQAPEVLYKESFVNFAIRYHYTDGEASCISPYSTTAFLPGVYSYSPKNGYNLGVENSVSDIDVYDIIPSNTPQDVTMIELLLKNSKSDNVYSVKKIKRRLVDWQSYQNSISIKEELFGSSVESSQLVRIYDAVPRKAATQEIQANRLMYGNYVENYDVVDEGGNEIKPIISAAADSDPIAFTNSLFSPNNFQATPSAFIYYGVSRQITYNQGGTVSTVTGDFVNAYEEVETGEPQSLLNRPLAFGVEYDPQNRFNQTINQFVYQVAEDGVYRFKAHLYGVICLADTTVIADQVAASKSRIVVFRANSDGTIHNSYTRLATGDFGQGNDELDIHGAYAYTSEVGTLTIDESVNLTAATTPYICFVVETQALRDFIDNGTGSYSEAVDSVFRGYFQNFKPYQNGDETTDEERYETDPAIAKWEYGIVESPSSVNAVGNVQGTPSIKSLRNYQLGVVYCDGLGRESSVLIDPNNAFYNPKSNSDKKTSIRSSIKSLAPYWARTYKMFVKETAEKYHNLVLEAAFDNNDGEYAWLVFNSSDISKVNIGDYLEIKKAHGTNVSNTETNAKWKIVDIQNEGSVEGSGDTATLSVGNVTIDLATIASASEIIGKFFVKVANNAEFTTNIGVLPISSSGNINGAVFETEPKKTVDLDLYYEVSQAYPIYLNEDLADTYIKKGDRVYIDQVINGGVYDVTQGEAYEDEVFTVTNVFGAKTFSSSAISSATSFDGYCRVKVDKPLPMTAIPADNGKIIMRFKQEHGGYVTAELALDVQAGSQNLYLKPFTHPTTLSPNSQNKIKTPWFNCFAFGNGVESDTIRDDFNETSIYPYIASGKQSGFKASLPDVNYKEKRQKNQIIFSQLYNEKSNVNRLNEFIAAENITKALNPEYGSIQKLFSRDTDLLTICEDKCLRILSKKDALFNADGNAQLLSSTNVLGQAITFAGDYGISTNPESFANDEFRCYFTDKKRGSIIRLSRDGITVVSDYGMKDWFFDNLKNANALVGSFDGRKDEYNITIHETTQSSWNKKVYTVSFSEPTNSWVSFKSFIPESGVTINNDYYTFKQGRPYLHHYDDNGDTSVFYTKPYDSSVTTLINDGHSTVKSFNVLNYEGSQSKVDKFSDESQGGVTYNDNEFYNASNKKGWYVDYIQTDLQKGHVPEFIKKEGKWFNYIKRNETNHSADSSNIDISDLSVQGLGFITGNVTSDGSSTSEGITITFTNSYGWNQEEFSSEGLTLTNIQSISASTPNSIVLTANLGYNISASMFTSITGTSSTIYDSVTFEDTLGPGISGNQVVATINWNSSFTLPITDLSVALNFELIDDTPDYEVLDFVTFAFDFDVVGDGLTFDYDALNDTLISSPAGTTQIIPGTAKEFLQVTINPSPGEFISTESIDWDVLISNMLVNVSADSILLEVVGKEIINVPFQNSKARFKLQITALEDYSFYEGGLIECGAVISPQATSTAYTASFEEANFNFSSSSVLNSEFSITTNLPIAPVVQFSNPLPSGQPSWLSQGASSNTTSSVYFAVANYSGTDQRSIIVKLVNPIDNSTVLATQVFTQEAAGAAYVHLSWNQDEWDVSTSDSQAECWSGSVPSAGSEAQPFFFGWTNADVTDANGDWDANSSITISYSSGSNWITLGSVDVMDYSSAGTTETKTRHRFSVAANTTTVDRTATITYTRPSTGETDQITLTQDADYYSSVHTVSNIEYSYDQVNWVSTGTLINASSTSSTYIHVRFRINNTVSASSNFSLVNSPDNYGLPEIITQNVGESADEEVIYLAEPITQTEQTGYILCKTAIIVSESNYPAGSPERLVKFTFVHPEINDGYNLASIATFFKVRQPMIGYLDLNAPYDQSITYEIPAASATTPMAVDQSGTSTPYFKQWNAETLTWSALPSWLSFSNYNNVFGTIDVASGNNTTVFEDQVVKVGGYLVEPTVGNETPDDIVIIKKLAAAYDPATQSVSMEYLYRNNNNLFDSNGAHTTIADVEQTGSTVYLDFLSLSIEQLPIQLRFKVSDWTTAKRDDANYSGIDISMSGTNWQQGNPLQNWAGQNNNFWNVDGEVGFSGLQKNMSWTSNSAAGAYTHFMNIDYNYNTSLYTTALTVSVKHPDNPGNMAFNYDDRVKLAMNPNLNSAQWAENSKYKIIQSPWKLVSGEGPNHAHNMYAVPISSWINGTNFMDVGIKDPDGDAIQVQYPASAAAGQGWTDWNPYAEGSFDNNTNADGLITYNATYLGPTVTDQLADNTNNYTLGKKVCLYPALLPQNYYSYTLEDTAWIFHTGTKNAYLQEYTFYSTDDGFTYTASIPDDQKYNRTLENIGEGFLYLKIRRRNWDSTSQSWVEPNQGDNPDSSSSPFFTFDDFRDCIRVWNVETQSASTFATQTAPGVLELTPEGYDFDGISESNGARLNIGDDAQGLTLGIWYDSSNIGDVSPTKYPDVVFTILKNFTTG